MEAYDNRYQDRSLSQSDAELSWIQSLSRTWRQLEQYGIRDTQNALNGIQLRLRDYCEKPSNRLKRN